MSKVRFYIITLFMVCFAATGCVEDKTGRSDAQKKEYPVRNVIDGDTIELADSRCVRYIGIDTPETMKRRGKKWEFDPEPYAVAAKEYNRALVSKKKVRLEFDAVKEDRYGRYLAYVYVDDGLMANAELVRKGYAVVYTFPPNVKHMDILLKAQQEARQAKRGLWGTIETISPEEAFRHIGKICAVKGRITEIYSTPDKMFLNFGKDRKKLLTAVIFTRNLQLFTKKGINPATYYKNKYVEAIGKIEYRKKLQITIDNPSMITDALSNSRQTNQL